MAIGHRIPRYTNNFPVRVILTPDTPVGVMIEWNGRMFVLMRIDIKTRVSDGQPYHVAAWQSDCMDCGSEYERTTSLTVGRISFRCGDCGKAWMARRGKKRVDEDGPTGLYAPRVEVSPRRKL